MSLEILANFRKSIKYCLHFRSGCRFYKDAFGCVVFILLSVNVLKNGLKTADLKFQCTKFFVASYKKGFDFFLLVKFLDMNQPSCNWRQNLDEIIQSHENRIEKELNEIAHSFESCAPSQDLGFMSNLFDYLSYR